MVAPRGFWTVLQEMGAEFVMSPGLLCGFRRGLLAVGSADLGKRRRIVAFRAGSPCEAAQKLRILACVSVPLVLVAGIAITCHQRPSWRIAVVGVSLIDVAKRIQRCVQIQPWRKPTLFSPSHKLCKTCSLV